jgi:hypothetical protein
VRFASFSLGKEATIRDGVVFLPERINLNRLVDVIIQTLAVQPALSAAA